ncbi:MAG: OmpA family protein [Elusimicrobia bacterium]|nr:OmpA family protein [Elusimicrobiota bacterium]
MKNRWMLLLALGLFGAGVNAGDATGRLGLGGAGGWSGAIAPKDAKQLTDEDTFASGWLRFGVAPKTEIILSYDVLGLDYDDTTFNRSEARPLTLGVWQSFGEGAWKPFLTVGLGAAELRRFDLKTETVFAAQGGAGLELFLARWLSVGAIGRLHWVGKQKEDYGIEATIWSAGLMGNVFFGGQGGVPAPAPVVEAKPAPAPVPAPVVIADADGDGVADALDKCPNTAVGTPVNADGCPRDSDNDGVIDALDKCPDTGAGVLVNAEGCPAEKVTVSLSVKFDSGKSDVKPDYESQIATVAEFMKRFPNTTVVIEGHTDNVGSAAGNKALSQKRADAVRAYLVEKLGVDAGRISARGFGPAQPLADNATLEGRAVNRRVVAAISAMKL